MIRWLAALTLLTSAAAHEVTEGDYVARDFTFASGEKLAELKLHYRTLGTPKRDPQGHVTNAVMILHGTGGSGAQFLQPQFANELFGPGQPLDTTKYYVILPDGIGHGASSKPSNGLRAKFPSYDYDDMVKAQHLLLTEGLKVDGLELLMGTSMGCMHGFVWGETWPGFAKRLAPFACLPVEIAGMNRSWRKAAMDGIISDPAWAGGNYTSEPIAGLKVAQSLLIVMGSAPIRMQAQMPTREAADKALAARAAAELARLDANDLLYQLNASRNYNPAPRLSEIKVPVLWINSQDDLINPHYLGIAENKVKAMPKARFILIPASAETRGHGSHTVAALWKNELAQFIGN